MPPLITVSMLGPVEVLVGGSAPPPELMWRKHLATALVLWTERPRPVSRDRLLALLWADRPEAAARHSLNEALRVIRRVCGGEVLDSTPTSVAWIGPLVKDTDEWLQRAGVDPVSASALVRGEWCEGFAVTGASACDDWLAGERDEWRGRLVECLVRAAASASDAGDTGAAIALAERARRIHPWSDDAALAVMRARCLAGDRTGALAAGTDHQRRLHEELGAAVAPSVAALLARLRAGDPLDADVSARPTPISKPSSHPPLLHRGAQLGRALEVVSAARSTGTATAVIWAGTSGSGRSRLLEETCARLQLDGMPVAHVHALPGDGGTAEAGLDALADALLPALPGLGGGDPAAIELLAARRPQWRERFPTAGAVATGALTHEAALLSVLRAAAEEGPFALAIDDLDRFHGDAIESVVALVRALVRMPVIFSFTVSAESDLPPVAALCRVVGRELPGAVLTSSPFDAALASDLVAWALPHWDTAARDRLERRLLAEAAGNTFIAVALVEALRDGLTLPERESTWPAADRTMDATFPGDRPTVLTIALRHAFHQLEQPHQRLLQRIAVGPEPWSDARMVRNDSEAAALAPLLDDLERGRWVASDQRGYFVPAAAVRRFVLEDTLTPGQLRRLRAGLADA